MQAVLDYFRIDTARELWWLAFGILAQSMFFLRFLVQWISSEKAKASVMPHAFWFFSLLGGIMLLIYGFAQREPIIILGQSVGIIIYLRNLWFIYGPRSPSA